MFDAAAGDVRVEVDPGERRVDVADGHGTLLAGEFLVVADGRTLPPEAHEPVTDSRGEGVVYGPTGDVPLETTVVVEPAVRGDDHPPGAVDLRVTVENVGEAPVVIERVQPLASDDLPAFGPGSAVFEQGYQSWSPTGARAPGERFPAEPPGQRPMMVDPAAPEGPRTSHFATALSAGDRGLALGFLDHERFLPQFHLVDHGEDDDHADHTAGVDHLGAVVPGEDVTVAPGARLELPTLRVVAGDVRDGLASIADAVAERMDARVPERPPTGWCSWYQYDTDVTADDVRENLAAVVDLDLPLATVQVDDGYQRAFGDWRTLTEGFADLPALSGEIRDRRREAGIWLAPFLAEADAEVVTANPDWVLTRDGDPVDAGRRHGQMVALDPTHPGVEAWLRDTVGTVVDDWGFDYLKLDFLYAAAMPGDRHEDVTRATAYRRGLRTIRETAGADAVLLGCGAPLAPSVGLVDAMRVGPDVGPTWDEGGAASQPGMENAVRNSLTRQWLHRRWWVNDPDCQLLRSGTHLTDAERRSFAAVVALSGGANVVSDRLRELDADAVDLLERTLPPVAGGRVEGVAGEQLPARLVCPRPADGGFAVAACNWADESREVTVDPADHGLEAAVGWDPFAAECVDGRLERRLAPHDALVVHYAVPRDRPHVLGAVEHLAGGGSLLAQVDWEGDGTGGRLSLSTGECSLRYVLAVPGGWRVTGDVNRVDDAVAVNVPPDGVAVHFERRS
jgi:alpha-galactosidase